MEEGRGNHFQAAVPASSRWAAFTFPEVGQYCLCRRWSRQQSPLYFGTLHELM